MEKKVYNVYLYYHGCINEQIVADSESEAESILRNKAEGMDKVEFFQTAGIIEDGSDVYIIGETCH